MNSKLENSGLPDGLDPSQVPEENKRQVIETHIHLHYEQRSELESLTVSLSPLPEVGQGYKVNFKQQDSGLYLPVAPESESKSPGINKEVPKIIRTRLSFGFCGNKEEMEKAEFVFYELTREIDLVNTRISKVADLVDVFFCRNIAPGTKLIRLGCYTNQYRYIVNNLQKWRFDSLTLTNIERSRMFYTKDNNPITRSLLSSATQRNMNKPKKVEEIDAIFKQLY